MDKTAELERKINELQSTIDRLVRTVQDSERKIETISGTLERHQHTDTDGTSKLRRGSEVLVESGAIGYIGNGGIGQTTSGTQNTLAIASGTDKGAAASGSPNSTTNSVILLNNQPNDGFLSGYTGPAYQNFNKSVTSGGNTITDTSFDWITDQLVGMYINIYDGTGDLKFTRQISSNTSSVITITGTWPSSVSGGIYFVFTPLYFGQSDLPYRRLYTGEGTGEGIRFGYGPTGAPHNGLLYMDSAGDLFWRDKSGSSAPISGASGATGFFTTVDGKTVTVTSGLVVSIV